MTDRIEYHNDYSKLKLYIEQGFLVLVTSDVYGIQNDHMLCLHLDDAAKMLSEAMTMVAQRQQEDAAND